MDHAKRGADALEAKDYGTAIEEYTAALRISPTSPDYLIKRSTARQRSSPPQLVDALFDAENAVIQAQKRAKREFIIQAQLRRGIALFGLGRFADARFVFDVVKRMDPKEKSLALWDSKTNMKLEALRKDGKEESPSVSETPTLSEPAPIKSEAKPETNVTSTSTTSQSTSLTIQTPQSKIRHDWYQSNETVSLTLLAKGVPKDATKVDILARSLAISFPLVTGSTYDFTLEPLFAEIDPSQSKYSILASKIEVTLRKKQPGVKWHALESTEPAGPEDESPAISVASKAPADSQLLYPSSSRTGPKNWDKIVDDITTKRTKPTKGQTDENGSTTEKNDNDDEYDYDNDGGDEVNGFFKKLYSGATEDQRRAMMKSFTESNGTALSTNWADVSKAPVKTQPPDGMVAKKWES